jgi:predicted Zn-dependent protease
VKLLVTLLAFAATTIAGAEPNDKLPDFGTPADMALSKSREAQLGRGVMLQLRIAGAVVDDPQLTEYIGSLGGQIASHANNGDFKFHFFFVKEDEINAFALPGGYVGVNSGLLLATNNENELAGVLAHEVSHVTKGTSLERCTTTST